jgi:hypothetical protein
MGWAERLRLDRPCPCKSGLPQKKCCRNTIVGFDADGAAIREVVADRPLTAAVCKDATAQVRESLAHFQVPIVAGGNLDQMLRALERVGELLSGPIPATGAITDRQRQEVRYVHQVTRLASMLRGLQLPRVSGAVAKELQTWLTKSFNSLETLDAEAQDHLFELEVAAALAHQGLCVSLEEPDLVVEGLPLVPKLAVACKRPRRLKKVDDKIREGIGQLRKEGLPGVVAVSFDSVLNADPGSRRPIPWVARSSRIGLDAGEEHFRTLIGQAHRRINSRQDPLLLGVVWICRVPVIVPVRSVGGASYSTNTYGYASVSTEQPREMHVPVNRLASALYDGLP